MIFLPFCPNDIILILFSISRPYGEACWKYKMLQAKETPKIAQINFLLLQTNSCDPYTYHYLLPILLQGLVFIKKISGILHCVFFKISCDRLVGLFLTIVSNPRYVLWRLIERISLMMLNARESPVLFDSCFSSSNTTFRGVINAFSVRTHLLNLLDCRETNKV